MPKNSKKANEKVGEVMEEFNKGSLKINSDDKVTKKKQAIAVRLSEAGQDGYKAPAKKNGSQKKSNSSSSSSK